MATRKKIRIISIIIAVVVVLILIVITFISNSVNGYDFSENSYIFSTVDDLNFLNESVVESNVKDKNLKDLKYTSSKSVQIKYDEKNYRLFAYEFNSKEDVFAYGKAVSGNDYSDVYERFGKTGWYYSEYKAIILIPLSNKMLLFDNTNVLYVESKVNKKQFNKFLDYLFTNLPQKVDLLPNPF